MRSREQLRWSRFLPARADAAPIATLAGVLLVLALVFLEYDILTRAKDSSAQEVWLEIEEAFVLSAVLIVGLFTIALRHMRRQRRELELRLAAEVELRQALELAMLDPLTGLANRRHFDDIFNAAALKSAMKRHALLLLDLDGFKRVNDLHGHPEGDEVLKIVASRLQNAVKKDDVVSRLGGDEFSIVAFSLGNERDALALGQRVVRLVSEPIKTTRQIHHISVSIGISLFPQEGQVAAAIFSQADAALYRAKETRSKGSVILALSDTSA